jgi:hypothetical protein
MGGLLTSMDKRRFSEMKFNFKKITPIIAGALLLGSTIGFASAADLGSYPAPFVSGGVADVAVIYGASADAQDVASGMLFTGHLGELVTSTGGTTVSGDAAKIETSGQKLYLGDMMNTTKEALTKDSLSILADGKIDDEDGTTFDYNLKIKTPNTYVKYGKTVDNLATPVLYVYFEDTNEYYDSEVVFPTAVNVTKMTNKDITLFGKKFTFSGSASDLTPTKVVMFENTEAKMIVSGGNATITVGGTTYNLAVTSVETDTKATITVNGVSQSVTEGTSYKISGLDVYVKNVIGPTVAGEYRGVELYAGSAKMTLQDGQSVVKGATTIYGTTATITNSSGKISKISIRTVPYSLDNRIRYLKIGDSFTDPVFGAFKIIFSAYSPELMASSKDSILIKSASETSGRIKYTNKAGNTYDLEIISPSAICVSTAGASNATGTNTCDTTNYPYNATKLGYLSGGVSYDVISGSTGQANENDWILTRNNEYSQAFRVDRIDVTNTKIRLKDDSTTSSTQEVSLNGGYIGSVATLTLADGSSATLNLTGNTTGANLNITCTKADPIFYTKSGARINLTTLTADSYNQTAGRIAITEETSYNDGDFYKGGTTTKLGDGALINVTMLYNRAGKTGNDILLNAPTVGDSYTSNVGDYDNYYITKYGTFVKQTGSDDKTVEIYYPSSAAYLDVLIGAVSATTSAGGAIFDVAIPDSDAIPNKNLIVIGGSAINKVAATLLGVSYPTYGTASGLAKDSAILKMGSNPSYSSKIAVLVAGWEAKDTKAAAKALISKSIALSGKTEAVLSTVTEATTLK